MSVCIPAQDACRAIEDGIMRHGVSAALMEAKARDFATTMRTVLGQRIWLMAAAAARDAALTWQEELMRDADHQNRDQP